MSRKLFAVVVVFAISGCGDTEKSAGATPMSEPPPQTASTGTASPPTTQVAVSDAAQSADALELVDDQDTLQLVPEVVGQAECFASLSELFDVDWAFRADSVAVGERTVDKKTDLGVPVVYRSLMFSNVQPLRGLDDVTRGSEYESHVAEAAVFGPEAINPRSFIDLEALDAIGDVTVIGKYGDAGLSIVRLVLTHDESSVGAPGSCDGLIDYVSGGLAERLGYSPMEFVEIWATGQEDFAAKEAAWVTEQDQPTPWEEQDPRVREVSPAAVPKNLRADLDVRAAVVDLPASSDPMTVVFASDDGIGLGVVTGSSRAALPFYYFTGTEGVINVVLVRANDNGDPDRLAKGTKLATFNLEDLAGYGGILVTGDLINPEVSLLTWTQVAEELDVNEADLEALRTEMLQP